MKVGWELAIYAMVLCLAIEEVELTDVGRTTPQRSDSATTSDPLPQCPVSEPGSMHGKTVLVTGGARGIGFEIANDLHSLGANIIIANRNKRDCKKARSIMKAKELGDLRNAWIDCISLDLSSPVSILDLVIALDKEVPKEYDKIEQIDVLIHNAGTYQFLRGRKTDTGQERTMMVNYVGPWYLTRLLMPKLKNAADAKGEARIILVTCDDHKNADLDVTDLNAGVSDLMRPAYHNYQNSKSALILFAMELNTYLAGSTVTVNAVNPGKAATNIKGAHVLSIQKKMALKMGGHTAAKSAIPIVALASHREYQHTSGRYFDRCEEKDLDRFKMKKNERLYTPERAHTLWITTEQLVLNLIGKEKYDEIQALEAPSAEEAPRAAENKASTAPKPHLEITTVALN